MTTHTLILEKWRWHEIAVGRKTYVTFPTDGGHEVGDVLQIHHHISSLEANEADLTGSPLLRRILSTEAVDGGRVILSIAPVTTPGKSPDRMMVEHLSDTLESIRHTIAVEKVTGAIQAALIGEIDQALTDAGEITGRVKRMDEI